jgi:hypothetical protein
LLFDVLDYVNEQKPQSVMGETLRKPTIAAQLLFKFLLRLLSIHVGPGERSHSLACAPVSACLARFNSASFSTPGGIDLARSRISSACPASRVPAAQFECSGV